MYYKIKSKWKEFIEQLKINSDPDDQSQIVLGSFIKILN